MLGLGFVTFTPEAATGQVVVGLSQDQIGEAIRLRADETAADRLLQAANRTFDAELPSGRSLRARAEDRRICVSRTT